MIIGKHMQKVFIILKFSMQILFFKWQLTQLHLFYARCSTAKGSCGKSRIVFCVFPTQHGKGACGLLLSSAILFSLVTKRKLRERKKVRGSGGEIVNWSVLADHTSLFSINTRPAPSIKHCQKEKNAVSHEELRR